MSKRITILIKPTDDCNLRCLYCYHSDYQYLSEKINISAYDKLIEMALGQYQEMHFIWHGGEPLLMSDDFYAKVNCITQKYNEQGDIKITHAMQTNGTLLSKERLSVFDSYNIGISFDGLSNSKNRGKTEETINAIDILKEKNKKVGVIKVVMPYDLHNLLDEYNYFKELDINVKYSPLFECGKIEKVEKYYSAKEYSDVMWQLFIYWINDEDSKIIIEPFESLLGMALGNDKRPCTYGSCLGKFLCVTYEGNIYPCSRYFPKQYLIGNIIEYNTIDECFESENYQNLIRGAMERREKCSQQCKLFKYCHGGCNNEAISNGDITRSGNFSCMFFKIFFPKVLNFIKTSNEIKNHSLKCRLDSLNLGTR